MLTRAWRWLMMVRKRHFMASFCAKKQKPNWRNTKRRVLSREESVTYHAHNFTIDKCIFHKSKVQNQRLTQIKMCSIKEEIEILIL